MKNGLSDLIDDAREALNQFQRSMAFHQYLRGVVKRSYEELRDARNCIEHSLDEKLLHRSQQTTGLPAQH